MQHITIISFLILSIFNSCDRFKTDSQSESKSKDEIDKKENLLTDIIPLYEDGDVNAIIEIPSGTTEKWELNKSTGQIQWEMIDSKPRIINYLGYPGNYGMIPRTLLSKEQGGDGDPLDIIVLGGPVERGSVIKCKIIGVLYLVDRGEQDDKLIAISADSPLYDVDNMVEINERYKGITEILHLWFTNYKGPGKMASKGFGDRNSAIKILEAAIIEYQLNDAEHIDE